MTEDPKVATKRISAADIDAIFGTVANNPVNSVAEEQRKKMDHKREDDQQTEVHKVVLFYLHVVHKKKTTNIFLWNSS